MSDRTDQRDAIATALAAFASRPLTEKLLGDCRPNRPFNTTC